MRGGGREREGRREERLIPFETKASGHTPKDVGIMRMTGNGHVNVDDGGSQTRFLFEWNGECQ